MDEARSIPFLQKSRIPYVSTRISTISDGAREHLQMKRSTSCLDFKQFNLESQEHQLRRLRSNSANCASFFQPTAYLNQSLGKITPLKLQNQFVGGTTKVFIETIENLQPIEPYKKVIKI